MGVVEDELVALRQGAAADPRDAVRLDRLVHRRGVGERRAARQRLGDVRRPRPRARRSTRATGRSARARGAASPACPRAATARSTSGSTIRASSASSRAGRATREAADIGSIFGHRRGAAGREHAARHARARRRGPAARARVHLVLQRHRRQVPVRRTQAFARELTRARVPHRFFLVRGGHNWALWRGNAARRLPRRGRRLVHA